MAKFRDNAQRYSLLTDCLSHWLTASLLRSHVVTVKEEGAVSVVSRHPPREIIPASQGKVTSFLTSLKEEQFD